MSPCDRPFVIVTSTALVPDITTPSIEPNEASE